MAKMISKILHFMWLDKRGFNRQTIPDKYRAKLDAWERHHPDFDIMLWFNPQFEGLLEHTSPELQQFYHSLPSDRWMVRCDLARLVILWFYGGLYADLDFYVQKSLAPLLEDKDLFLVREVREHEYYGKPQLCHGIIGASPRHPFISDWIDFFVGHYEPDKSPVVNGPVRFWEYYVSLPNSPKLADTCAVLAYTDKRELAAECRKRPIDIYAYTLWDEGSTVGVYSKEAWPTASRVGHSWILLLLGCLLSVCVILALVRARRTVP